MPDSSSDAPSVSYTNTKSCFPWRFTMAALGCFAFTISYGMRSNISVAIVAMVNSSGSGNESSECPRDNSSSSSTSKDKAGEFDWDAQLQGIILSSFFWGYLLPQVLGGRFAEQYGPKYVMLFGGSLATLMTFLAPLAARIHVVFFIVTRFVCGLGLSVFTPSCLSIVARWAHPSERSFFASIIYSGCSLGTVFAMPISGLMCEHAPDGGWPWAFYFFGLLSTCWLITWAVLMYNSPADHPWISTNERFYIEDSIKASLNFEISPPIPWRKIWKSKAVWAILLAYFGNGWGNYTLLTQLPSYMSSILGFDIQQNGFMSSLPYVMAIAVAYTSGLIVDFLIKRKVIQTVIGRKFCTVFAMYSCGFCLFGITFLNCETMAIYALLVLGIGLNGTSYGGHLVNAVGIAPNFAGTIQGIGNTIGTIPGIISPYLTGVLTEGGTIKGWSNVFYLSFSIMIFFGTIYLFCAEDAVQYWNDASSSMNEIVLNGKEMTDFTLTDISAENVNYLNSNNEKKTH